MTVTLVLVPTPSVLWTITGSVMPFTASASEYSVPKEPSPVSTADVWVFATCDFMRRTASLPASMSTPEDL